MASKPPDLIITPVGVGSFAHAVVINSKEADRARRVVRRSRYDGMFLEEPVCWKFCSGQNQKHHHITKVDIVWKFRGLKPTFR